MFISRYKTISKREYPCFMKNMGKKTDIKDNPSDLKEFVIYNSVISFFKKYSIFI